ncbi:MAG: Rrf2 family transcriptional regulator [Selenomonadales bacterium]|nr:Rrf2 family transcriptional regulator [Selenomonadales bacterium]
MKISTKGRYALRLMLDLAIHQGAGPVSLKTVSARQGITVKYLEQIVPCLSRAGYLKSYRGIGGGYLLAKAPEEYRIGDILRTAENSLAPTACVSGSQSCDRCEDCLTRPFWIGLDQAIADYVNSVTLADLLRENGI